MKSILSLAACLFTWALLTKSNAQDKNIPEQPFIEVTGTASREISPDRIFIAVGLSEKSNSNDPNDVDNQETTLKNILSGMNIPASQVFLSDAGSEIVKERRKDAVIKYSKQYNIELHSATEVSQLFRKFNEQGIKDAAIIRVDHSKIDSLRKEVRILAIKAAKDKADYLTTAVGEHIGKAMHIREEPVYAQNNFRSTNNLILNSSMDGIADNEPNSPDFKKIKITFSYYIKYALL